MVETDPVTPLPLAEVKSHLSELVNRVSSHHERATVTVHGRPSAVLVAVDDLEAMEETIAILSDSEAMRQLSEAESRSRGVRVSLKKQLAQAMQRRRRFPSPTRMSTP